MNQVTQKKITFGRFASIRWKLYWFVVLIATSVALSMYGVMQWSVDRGFLSYVNQRDISKIDKLIPELAGFYRHHRSWQDFVDKPQLWQKVLDDFLSESSDEKETSNYYSHSGEINHRTLLFDAQKQQIAGIAYDEHEPCFKPIQLDNKTVGYVGLLPRESLTEYNDVAFLQSQQHGLFIVTGLVILGFASLVLPLAGSFVRPIEKLRFAMEKLAKNQSQVPLVIKQKDELGLLAQDFNRLKSLLEQQEELRKQWLADIAHELRTPISVLQAELEAMEDGIRAFNQESIHSLKSDLQRLTHVVKDLHYLALEDLAAQEYQLSPLCLASIVEQAIARYQQPFGDKGIQISLDNRLGENDLILLDLERIYQLINNLLSNSLKYTHSPGKLRVRLEAVEDGVEMIWQDSAPAVPDKSLPLLFERLYRVDSSRDRNRGGSGLGLSIVKAIVERHGGVISASHSELGGLKLVVRLPKGKA
ncbi:HAMP domain-containing protein [Vibrio sp. OCN044]|uniref:histidine kinase n=1 Tax=Vibrio tetraodonis subsp. pristinus TaxID=2695891 RepID=A0A6L8LY05_9VIBR|nr:ATP-binding protein [Vibrio tetraodonis]MYM61004.1 HAMP domain-containing protein [Vibrio tetraodonis subsp. pristinus]